MEGVRKKEDGGVGCRAGGMLDPLLCTEMYQGSPYSNQTSLTYRKSRVRYIGTILTAPHLPGIRVSAGMREVVNPWR